MKAMAREPNRRYSSAAAMADDLSRFLNRQPIAARRVGIVERTRLWSSRNPAIASMILILATGVIVTVVGSLVAASKFGTMAINATRVSEERTRDLYFAEMNQAVAAAQSSSGISNLNGLLNHWIPKSSETDQREWEWHWLNSIAQRACVQLEIPTHVWEVQFSPDEQHLCFVTHSQAVVVTWPSLQQPRVLELENDWQRAARFSPDGSLLAMGSGKNSLYIWDWANQNVVQEFQMNTELLHPEAICWSPDGQLLLVQLNDFGTPAEGRLNIYQTSDWGLVTTVENNNRNFVNQFSFKPDGKQIAICGVGDGGRGSIKILDTSNWKLIQKKDLHRYSITSVAWNPRRNLIASASGDSSVIIWEPDQDTEVVVASGGMEKLCPLASRWSTSGPFGSQGSISYL